MMTLTLEEKVGQMLFAGFEGLYPPDYILDWLATSQIGGIILFARNIDNPQQLVELTGAVHRAAKYPALIAIDQEGGAVARLRQVNGFTESPGAMALSAAQDGERWAERVNAVLGREMQALGINWTFAPAVDISYNTENPTVGTRSFGSDKEQVSQMTVAAVKGFQNVGVAACAKHFPGLGDTKVDSHLELPVLDTTLVQLIHNDLLPYRAAMQAGVATMMTTHTVFNELDSRYPATLSPVVVQRLIREELRFDGVVCSDCMEMKAISDHYPPSESVVLAALTGIDAILFSHTRSMQEAAYESLLAAVYSHRVPVEVVESANRRIANLKSTYPAAVNGLDKDQIQEDRALVLEAARAAITVVKDHPSLLPVLEGAVLVEFASYMDSEVMKSGGVTGFGQVFQKRFPQIPLISLKAVGNMPSEVEKTLSVAQQANPLVLITRNAHLIPEELDMAKQLVSVAKNTVLICLRNPYDAKVLAQADLILCTFGDSAPSIQAAVDVLAGDFNPTGRLPVSLL